MSEQSEPNLKHETQLLNEKQAEYDLLTSEYLGQLKKLKAGFERGDIDEDSFNRRSLQIKCRIQDLSASFELFRDSLEGSKKPKKREYRHAPEILKVDFKWYLKAFLLLMAIFLIGVYFFTNMTCVPIGFSTKTPQITSILEHIRTTSPQDYQMICGYVKSIGYGGMWEGINYDTASIQVSEAFLSSKDEPTQASQLVQRSCKIMMRSVMGGFKGLNEYDIAVPCYRMQYMFLKRSGYFASYNSMQEALSKQLKEREPTLSDIGGNLKSAIDDKVFLHDAEARLYCNRTRVQVKEMRTTDYFDLTITNDGVSVVPCCMIGLTINNVDHPLDCIELRPGQSFLTGKDFKFRSGDAYSAEIMGCGRIN